MKKTWNETIKLATPVINFLSSLRRRQLLPELAAAFAPPQCRKLYQLLHKFIPI